MEPIVHGIRKRYAACIRLERVNFHAHTSWHELLFPLGSPEFALLDSSEAILYRWFGFTEADEFTQKLDPLCGG